MTDYCFIIDESFLCWRTTAGCRMSNWINIVKESRLVKALVYTTVGSFSYPGLAILNRLKITGMEDLRELPARNVLFVCNHQTYFTDVIALLHVFCAVSVGKKRRLGIPYYLLWPYTRIKFVSAEETMKKNLMGRLLSLAGSIWVKRTWVAEDQSVRKGLSTSDTRKITSALAGNWVITFPQGTTTPYVPGRKGTAFLIKQCQPIVVPVVIDGFGEAFTKKGLGLRKTGTRLSIHFKKPLAVDYADSLENILEQVMDAIEQSPKYYPAGYKATKKEP